MTQLNIDFETRSTVDLGQAGAHLYADSPTTEVMCMAWSIDGKGPFLWRPGMPFPRQVAAAIQSGAEAHAWNAAFERLIWPIMVRRHGAPPIALEQWRCTMVRALLCGFPASLDHAGPSMGLAVSKDKAGHQLMLRVSKPRKVYRRGDPDYNEALDEALARQDDPLPEFTQFEENGKLCAARWWVDEDRIRRLERYCVRDVEVEFAAGEFLDPIPPMELAGWRLDQRINDRGFYVDMELVHKARGLVKPATLLASEELKRVTGGELNSVTKPNDIRAWLNKRLGLELDSIDKQTLAILLAEHPALSGDSPKDPVAVKVIQLRLAGAKTSTAKLNALVRGTSPDGQFRGGLQYAGAGRTGRWAGRRAQWQNVPRPAPWAVEAIPYVQRGDLTAIGLLFDTPLEAISSILRSCLTARPGHELTVADYNAIEARVAAWFAGAEKILDAYATGKDPYRIMAARIFGYADWREVPKGGIERFLGKKIILGCFAADTLVLTQRGWIPIVNVSTADTVWDGEAWVNHSGVIFQGVKKTVEYAGVRATPEHPVLTPGGWASFLQVAQGSTSLQSSAHGSAGLPFEDSIWDNEEGSRPSVSRATAHRTRSIRSISTTLCTAGPPSAGTAPLNPPLSGTRVTTGSPASCLTETSDKAGLIGGTPCSPAVTGRGPMASKTTGPGASTSRSGGTTVRFSSGTSRPLRDGTTLALSLTESTMTDPTPAITSQCGPEVRTSPTEGTPSGSTTKVGSTAPVTLQGSAARPCPTRRSSGGSKKGSHPANVSQTSTLPEGAGEPVYDVVNAGPRARFTIWTQNGPLIVHNCQYGLGKKRFWESCREDGLFIEVELAARSIDAYRSDNPEIPAMWRALDAAALWAMQNPHTWVPCLNGKVHFFRDDRYLRMRLPSGRQLSYLEPRLLPDVTPWGAETYKIQFWGWNGMKNRMEWQTMWGGRWAENLCQATARDLMLDAALRLDADGWGIILSVHDELLTDNPKGERTSAQLESEMAKAPAWAADLPLKVEGWTGHRYRK